MKASINTQSSLAQTQALWRFVHNDNISYQELSKPLLENSLQGCREECKRYGHATDFDREGELIGYDAMHMVREVNEDAPISRARYSAITKPEITRAFGDLTSVDESLAHAGESR